MAVFRKRKVVLREIADRLLFFVVNTGEDVHDIDIG